MLRPNWHCTMNYFKLDLSKFEEYIFLDISIREEVKPDIGSEDSLKSSGISLPVHRVLNFHFRLWLTVEKVLSSMIIGK